VLRGVRYVSAPKKCFHCAKDDTKHGKSQYTILNPCPRGVHNAKLMIDLGGVSGANVTRPAWWILRWRIHASMLERGDGRENGTFVGLVTEPG